MPNSPDESSLAAAREAFAHRLTFEEFITKLPVRDRATAERRVAALNTAGNAEHAALWQRLAAALMTLAPHAAKLIGKQTLQLYVADGKYRMQVFALEDLQDQKFTIYCPDILEEAMKLGLLLAPHKAEPSVYTIAASNEPLTIESLSGTSRNPAAHFKDMTGWNRKAIAIALPPTPTPTQVEAAELLCAIAFRHFPKPSAQPASNKPA